MAGFGWAGSSGSFVPALDSSNALQEGSCAAGGEDGAALAGGDACGGCAAASGGVEGVPTFTTRDATAAWGATRFGGGPPSGVRTGFASGTGTFSAGFSATGAGGDFAPRPDTVTFADVVIPDVVAGSRAGVTAAVFVMPEVVALALDVMPAVVAAGFGGALSGAFTAGAGTAFGATFAGAGSGAATVPGEEAGEVTVPGDVVGAPPSAR